jgi:uncharacterized membrane protein YbaN (DUF454 family)
MILLDIAPDYQIVGILAAGLGLIIVFLLILAALVFVGYKLLRRKKNR